MSIYASLPGIDRDEPCGAPWQYLGSHVLPHEDDPRGGEVDLALIPSHITRAGRDDQPEDGTPWPWLRLSLDHCGDDPAVVINPAQARQLAAQLTAWADSIGGPVADQPRTDVRIVNTRTGQGVATGGNDPDVIGWSWPRAEPAGTDECDQSTSDAATHLRLAHQARRAKNHQLDDVRRALCDVGAIDDGDPYSHADLADVIRQVWGGESADARARLAEVRRYAELAAGSCRVNVGQTGEDILRILDDAPPGT